MVTLPNRRAGEIPDLPPMPPYASSSAVLELALPSLSPATRMGVVDAAEEYMKVNANGRWADFDRGVTPYMIEPANMTISRRYREVIFAGPARAGKTVMLMSTVSHLVICDPGVCQIVHMTEATAEAWVDEELMPMIENSPELAKRQGRGRSDRNILSKKFIGGAKISIGPPTKAFLSGKTTRTVLFTDLDRMALTIGKEGSPFAMGAKRTETLGSRGMTVAEASPGHVITDPAHKPKTPHEAPPCAGILGLYNGGTRGRWYWDCPQCGEAFAPRFDRLDYDKTLSPADAGASAGGLYRARLCVMAENSMNRRRTMMRRAGFSGLPMDEIFSADTWLGNGANRNFITGVDLVNNKGMLWVNNRIIYPGPLIDVDGLPVRSWSFREKTADELAGAAAAVAQAGKAECRRRIFAVVDEMAQINLAAASGAGLLDAEQMAAYIAGLGWITQMRGTWPGLVDTGADLSDDANWPAVPDGAAALVAAF
jgi:hypothetical protein